ncbi:helix-turn-helix domain-containing protein [Catenovulum agarivorans]|uniref:helix-turn-helix domain-containing protein n=1 Tax=Catenovulum agarivorans TaxID=1172192 RepID=UPI0002FC9C0D|nr:helix-turn-helix domain-containing protein [Catenovulum agarivorans]
MLQNHKIIDALKLQLKQKGITYKMIAEQLQLSEGSIKRIFSNYDFTLERLESVCQLADLEIFDLVELAKEQTLSTDILSYQHEAELVSDVKLLLTAHLLINKWTVHQILNHYQIDKLTMVQLLCRLDRMDIIDYLPNEKVRLKVSRKFAWIKNGPIQTFFQQHIESDFFNCDFNSPGEIKLFVSGMLTKSSNSEMRQKIKNLAMSFDALHKQDEHELLENKFGTSLVIAMRPWDIELFHQLRKPDTDKPFE